MRTVTSSAHTRVPPTDGVHPVFNGNPRRYRNVAIIMSLAIHVYLYLGMVVLTAVLNGQTWIFGSKPILVAVASALVFGRTCYSWMMRLDAQYGKGSAWKLQPRAVKLPEFVGKSRRRSG